MIGVHPADWFGRGRGGLRGAAPLSRLLAWMLVTAACLLLRPSLWHELAPAAGLAIVWLAVTRPPLSGIFRLLGLCLVMFLPVFLLLPFTGRSEEWIDLWGLLSVRRDAWAAPLNVLVRGAFCLLLAYGLLAAMEEHEFQQALSRLPIPRILVVMMGQVLRWLTPLLEESASIGRAVALRGGSRGLVTGLRLMRALPSAWLPRLLLRAERVSAAMQVRDYEGELMDADPWKPAAIDAVALLGAGLALGGAVVMLCLR